MTYTRKHFVAVAVTLRDSRANMTRAQWLEVRDEFSHQFQRDNPRFDRVRFERACDGETGAR